MNHQDRRYECHRVRKLGRNWSRRETERLISLVKAREELWNPANKGYVQNALRKKTWEEIGDIMGMSNVQAVNKWNSLRNSFRTIYRSWLSKKKDTQTEWDFDSKNEIYRKLAFLKDVFCSETQMQMKQNIATKDATSSSIENTTNQDSISQKMISNSFTKKEAIGTDLDEDESTCFTDMPVNNERQTNDKDDRICTSFESFYPEEEDDDRKEVDNESNFDSNHSNTIDDPIKTFEPKRDNWQFIGDFVAFNGREYERKHKSLASHFRAAIYKTLADYQIKAAEFDEPNLQKGST